MIVTGAYTTKFFETQHSGSRQSAERVVPLIIDLIRPRSVVDIGCGVGTWLAVFFDQGVEDILGVDGDYVDRDMLQIPEERFLASDLTKPIKLDRRFDLVCCLEVAEHLAAECAETLIDTLTGLGPVILFSAAVPYQGGTKHVNEQWPEYWANLFNDKGYLAIDCLRATIWQNPNVEWWYAQNILLYVERAYLNVLDADGLLRSRAKDTAYPPPSLIHPTNYLQTALKLRLCRELTDIVPAQDHLILVAESLAPEFPVRNMLPFLEHDGVYWGNPRNDDEAIRELERMRSSGSAFIVFSWLSFWWLDYYSGLREYLRGRFPCVRENECLIAFDLRNERE
jgi:SAM-dependent methyltransferase